MAETPVEIDDSPVLRPDSPGRWFGRLVKGIAVGVGAILPGLSGGVLAVIFKLYDPLIRFLAKPQRNFWRNVAFFIPIGIGVGLGILGFAVVVEAAFGRFAAQFGCLFIGFVIGTFPSLYRQAGKRGRGVQHLTVMWVAAAAIFVVMLAGGQSAALLQVTPIIPLAVGLIACVLLFAKAAAWAFDRHYAGMYHFILGMVIGSSLAIFPTVVFPAFTADGLADARLSLPVAVAFAVALLIVGIIASYLFSKVEGSYSDQREALEEAAQA